jgi:hypothetical protein
MTLPFRRRHHDDDSAHDRARALWSTSMVERLEPSDSSWLESHLATCAECRLENQTFAADRELLRTLRDRPPEPPRDLWARTAAAIEQEATRRKRGPLGVESLADRLLPRRNRAPLGVLSGVLVVLVVVAMSLGPRLFPIASPPSPGGTAVAAGTPLAAPTQLAVTTAPLGWVETASDGSYQLLVADVDEVCPSEKTGCAPLRNSAHTAITLGEKPQALVGSPTKGELVVVSGSTGGGHGSVIVVPVSTASPSPTASAAGPSQPPTATPTAAPTTASIPPASPTESLASTSPSESVGPTPVPTPEGAHSIADGVVVVGETRYSDNGKWLAFSAAPLDGSTGPDLYVWNGVDASATRVTSDHATYFSSWLGDRILASRLTATDAAPGESPAASAASPTASATARATSSGSSGPSGSAEAGTIIIESHPSSFVFDPATGVATDLSTPDVWLPTVDRRGRFVTYWAGTLRTGPGLQGRVELGVGRLVLDGWTDSPGHGQGPASPAASQASPGSSPAAPEFGPVGTPTDLATGPITAFDTRFDPSGTRLAVWVADATNPNVGKLRLLVLDQGTGQIDATKNPLPEVLALKGISMDEGRLAWVTPPGQDGNQSTVQVLAWSGDDFGQVETVPGTQLTIVR